MALKVTVNTKILPRILFSLSVKRHIIFQIKYVQLEHDFLTLISKKQSIFAIQYFRKILKNKTHKKKI